MDNNSVGLNRGYMSTTAEEAKSIAEMINPIFQEYMNKYSEAKYPPHDYENFKKSYSSFYNPNNDIAKSIAWKYGHVGKTNFPEDHKNLIKRIEQNWSSFVASEDRNNSEKTFRWWRGKLTATSYITAAYITHLVYHSEPLPIIDQHNFRAMNDFLSKVRGVYHAKMAPRSWNDIVELKMFMVEVLRHLSGKSFSELDRFLMMYGKSIKPRKPRKSAKP
jgi:hypothetical protein